MKIASLSDFLKIKTSSDVDNFLRTINRYTLEETSLKIDDIKDNWRFVGDNINNNASIAILDDPNKGLIERVTNAIDAVIDKEFKNQDFKDGVSTDNVIKSSFPNYWKMKSNLLPSKSKRLNSMDAKELVYLVFHDGSKQHRPTVDVMDAGIGIHGDQFANTILSLQNGNKSTESSSHQIGSFGQGGSTTLSHSYATLILSKFKNEYFGTIVKAVDLYNQKSMSYVYFSQDSHVISLLDDKKIKDIVGEEHVVKLLENESGTIVRMIETEIDIQYRQNEISKPLSMIDYVNTELFDSPLPIKLIELRKRYIGNTSKQGRYAYGSKNALKTTKHVIEDFSGSFDINHKGRPYKINYYIILPIDQNDWPIDSKCREDFRRFNIHGDPLIYTMNGQFIASEKFTRFRNIDSLRFLQHRLLITVDLDGLGKEKYKFVTSNRKSIQKIDLSSGFFDEVLKKLSVDENLKNVNDIIGELTIKKPVDASIIQDITESVRGIYKGVINNDRTITTGRKGGNYQKEEVEYQNEITYLKITNTKDFIYKDQQLNLHIETGAFKNININSNIHIFVNGKENTQAEVKFYNGRIQYTFDNLVPNIYAITADYYDDTEILQSNTYEFEVLNKDNPNPVSKIKKKDPKIEIELVEGKEEIISFFEDSLTKAIKVSVCLDHEELNNALSMYSPEKIINYKDDLIKPMTLYILFMKDHYQSIENIEYKNEMIVSLVKTIVSSKLI